MKKQQILTVCVVLALTSGLNGCAWMSNTMARAKERIAAIRDRITHRAEAPAADAAEPPAPEVVAASNGAGAPGAMTAGAHHVVSGAGKPIFNSAGECVNTGSGAGAAHAGGCVGTAAVAESAAPAPVVEAMPAPQQPAVSATQMPEARAAAPAAARVEPQAQSSGELFPPASEPQASAPAAATPPAPVAAAAPPVVEQPMPKPPAPIEKFTLSADALFAFAKHDEANMSAEGKRKLADVAEQIKRMPAAALTRVEITGHADRLGRMDRNQRLSERRAQTVRNYLTKLGVPANLMSAAGRGETQPVVSCSGNKRTAKLKNCLGPNRRVEVAFFGSGEKMAKSQ